MILLLEIPVTLAMAAVRIPFRINEGSTATLQDNTLFWFTAGAPILGEGKLVAGKTEIVGGTDGGWTVGGPLGSGNDTVLIGAADDRTSSIAVYSTTPTASKIGGKTVGKLPGISSTLVIYTDTAGVGGTPASGNFLGITVTTANDGISSGSIENLIIDSTMLVE